jgi:aryl-alcohol dehydrogenase-like predicted oxidoreductase
VKIRRLGDSARGFSLVGIGCNNFGTRIDEERSHAVVRAALDAGINHFDTAESYGNGQSETFLGRALAGRRDEALIATKFAARPADEPYHPGALKRRVLEACEGSLKRLGTDRIDLYYQHHPDAEAPVHEALEALDELVAKGKVVCAACSNFSGQQIQEAALASAERGWVPFRAGQIHWNLLARDVETEIVPALRDNGMGIVPYFPLESGLLTGKYRSGEAYPEGSRLARAPRFGKLATEEAFAYIEELTRFAEERGHTLLELAFGWLAAQDGVLSIIAGATSPKQVAANVKAGQAWPLTGEELRSVPRMDRL